MWIDTHCHLDAPEFDPDRDAVVARAGAAGVTRVVLPAVDAGNWDAVRALAHRHGWYYALGIHPLFVGGSHEDDLQRLRDALADCRDDPRLVAVGEIGLDYFVPGHDPARQGRFYAEQLRIASDLDLPVVLHSRRAVDAVLAGLRQYRVPGGIAHAFNGSAQQADHFLALRCRLGFGGAMTHLRALRIRRLAASVPLEAIVLETDAPDIPPQWLYRTADQRAAGETARNEPAELPRIAETFAQLRGMPLDAVAAATTANARAIFARLP